MDSDFITKAKFVSVWDGGIEIKTKCVFNGETKIVSDIETAFVSGLDTLEDEYVLLPSGVEVRDFINENDIENY